MPLPTFDSDKDINSSLPDAYGVTEPRMSPWLTSILHAFTITTNCFSRSTTVTKSIERIYQLHQMSTWLATSVVAVFSSCSACIADNCIYYQPALGGEPPRLLTGSEDGTIIWDASVPCNDDLRDFGQRTIHIINAHEGSVIDVAFAGLEFYVSSGRPSYTNMEYL